MLLVREDCHAGKKRDMSDTTSLLGHHNATCPSCFRLSLRRRCWTLCLVHFILIPLVVLLRTCQSCSMTSGPY